MRGKEVEKRDLDGFAELLLGGLVFKLQLVECFHHLLSFLQNKRNRIMKSSKHNGT